MNTDELCRIAHAAAQEAWGGPLTPWEETGQRNRDTLRAAVEAIEAAIGWGGFHKSGRTCEATDRLLAEATTPPPAFHYVTVGTGSRFRVIHPPKCDPAAFNGCDYRSPKGYTFSPLSRLLDELDAGFYVWRDPETEPERLRSTYQDHVRSFADLDSSPPNAHQDCQPGWDDSPEGWHHYHDDGRTYHYPTTKDGGPGLPLPEDLAPLIAFLESAARLAPSVVSEAEDLGLVTFDGSAYILTRRGRRVAQLHNQGERQ